MRFRYCPLCLCCCCGKRPKSAKKSHQSEPNGNSRNGNHPSPTVTAQTSLTAESPSLETSDILLSNLNSESTLAVDGSALAYQINGHTKALSTTSSSTATTFFSNSSSRKQRQTQAQEMNEIVVDPSPGRESTRRTQRFIEARATAIGGNKEGLKDIVAEESWLLDARDSLGRTLLMYAVFCDRDEVVKWLLRKGADPEVCDNLCRNSIHWATEKGAHRSLKVLLSHMVSVWSKKPRRERKFRLESLLIQGDSDGITPLHFAARLVGTKCLQTVLTFLENRHPSKLRRNLSTNLDLNSEKDKQDEQIANLSDSNQRSPLHYAAAAGRPGNLLMLLSQDYLGLNIDQVDSLGRNPLMWAVMSKYPGGVECARIILETAPWTSSAQDLRFGLSPIHLAVIRRNLAAVSLLLEHLAGDGASLCRPDILDNQFRTPLHWAARLGLTEIVEALLRAGAQTQLRDSFGVSPVHYAAQCNHKDALKILLQVDRTTEMTDLRSRTPLMWAATCGSREVLIEILRSNPSVDRDQRDTQGSTALHLAAQSGQIRIVEILLSRGWNSEAKDSKGMTPLLCAAEKGHAVIVHALLKAGANFNEKDVQERTAMHWAALGGHAYICQLLRKDHGMSPDILDAGGRSPMHCAAFGGFMGCISVLLQGGANPALPDHEGLTPLHMAAKAGQIEAIHLLLDWDSPANAIASSPSVHGEDEFLTPYDVAIINGQEKAATELILGGGVPFEFLQNLAATKIQAAYKGFLVRKRVFITRL